MSVVKRIINDSIERVQVDELLAKEYEGAGYGGITLTKTPLGSQINLFAMRPGRVIGKRGRAIKAASARLEDEIGLSNPQITVIEVEVPEMNPAIMASRVANALERGVHFRRAIFWSLRRIMESGAMGCEVLLKGPLRSSRSRFEKVVEGYVPKAGEPALRYVKTATIHVKMKRGTLGVTVKIVPPDAKFPDKVSLEGLPDIEYQYPEPEPVPEAAVPVEETAEPVPAVEPVAEAEEPVAEVAVEPAAEAVEPVAEVAVEPAVEPVAEVVEEPVAEVAVEPAVEPVAEVVEEPVAEVTEEPAVEPIAEPEEPKAEVEPIVEEPVEKPVEEAAKVPSEEPVEEAAEVPVETVEEVAATEPEVAQPEEAEKEAAPKDEPVKPEEEPEEQ